MQQVNLLQGLIKPKIIFSANQILLLCVSFLGLLLCVSGVKLAYFGWQYFQYIELTNEKSTATQQFQSLARQYPVIARDKGIVDTVNTLSAQYNQKLNAYDLVTQARLVQGFSPYMQALATYVPASISLSHILINQKTGNMVLKGQARKPVSVSKMIDALYKSEQFKRKHFKLYALDEGTHIVKFEVATKEFHYRSLEEEAE